MKYLVGGLVVLLVALIIMVSFYLGAFKTVTFAEKQFPPLNVVYKEYQGPYHKIVPTLEEVAALVRTRGESCERSFGEFLDNPKEVDEDRLRSRVGCLVEQPLDELPAGYKSAKIDYPSYLVAVFTGSPAIGPFKVYPKAEALLAQRPGISAGPPIEIYRILNAENNEMETNYLFPLKTASPSPP